MLPESITNTNYELLISCLGARSFFVNEMFMAYNNDTPSQIK